MLMFVFCSILCCILYKELLNLITLQIFHLQHFYYKVSPPKVKSVCTLFTCIQFACSGCTANKSTFGTSTYVLVSRRYVASLSVALAFLLTGYTHSGYHKTLGRSLGIPVLRPRSIFTVLKNGYSHIQGMLQCVCDGAKKAMKALPVAHNLEVGRIL